jgi:hypothetical protein
MKDNTGAVGVLVANGLKDDSAYDTFLFQFLASELTTCSGSTLWECNGDIFRWFYKAKNWFISYKQKPETGVAVPIPSGLS